MRTYLVSFAAALFAFPCMGQQGSDREVLTYLKEVEWPKAYREQDTALLDRILASEFQMIDDQGNWYTKQDELEYIKGNKPSYESFRYEIKRLDIFENATAVVSGVGHIRSQDEEGPYLSTYHSSNVLIKRKGIWKAISSHVSGIKKMYIVTD
ncbi:MAG: nuclear transport factor 2 family protein [Saprospiraceae bacterium]|nr:nuclear transport factor 2 family protein [Saprospiraceae bacterium]